MKIHENMVSCPTICTHLYLQTNSIHPFRSSISSMLNKCRSWKESRGNHETFTLCQHPLSSLQVQVAWWAGMHRQPLSTSPTAAPVLCSKPAKPPCHQWSGSRHSEVLSTERWTASLITTLCVVLQPSLLSPDFELKMCNDVHLEQS